MAVRSSASRSRPMNDLMRSVADIPGDADDDLPEISPELVLVDPELARRVREDAAAAVAAATGRDRALRLVQGAARVGDRVDDAESAEPAIVPRPSVTQESLPADDREPASRGRGRRAHRPACGRADRVVGDGRVRAGWRAGGRGAERVAGGRRDAGGGRGRRAGVGARARGRPDRVRAGRRAGGRGAERGGGGRRDRGGAAEAEPASGLVPEVVPTVSEPVVEPQVEEPGVAEAIVATPPLLGAEPASALVPEVVPTVSEPAVEPQEAEEPSAPEAIVAPTTVRRGVEPSSEITSEALPRRGEEGRRRRACAGRRAAPVLRSRSPCPSPPRWRRSPVRVPRSCRPCRTRSCGPVAPRERRARLVGRVAAVEPSPSWRASPSPPWPCSGFSTSRAATPRPVPMPSLRPASRGVVLQCRHREGAGERFGKGEGDRKGQGSGGGEGEGRREGQGESRGGGQGEGGPARSRGQGEGGEGQGREGCQGKGQAKAAAAAKTAGEACDGEGREAGRPRGRRRRPSPSHADSRGRRSTARPPTTSSSSGEPTASSRRRRRSRSSSSGPTWRFEGRRGAPHPGHVPLVRLARHEERPRHPGRRPGEAVRPVSRPVRRPVSPKVAGDQVEAGRCR